MRKKFTGSAHGPNHSHASRRKDLRLSELLVEYKCSGTIISESPVLEADALRMKKTYDSLKNK